MCKIFGARMLEKHRANAQDFYLRYISKKAEHLYAPLNLNFNVGLHDS